MAGGRNSMAQSFEASAESVGAKQGRRRFFLGWRYVTVSNVIYIKKHTFTRKFRSVFRDSCHIWQHDVTNNVTAFPYGGQR